MTVDEQYLDLVENDDFQMQADKELYDEMVLLHQEWDEKMRGYIVEELQKVMYNENLDKAIKETVATVRRRMYNETLLAPNSNYVLSAVTKELYNLLKNKED